MEQWMSRVRRKYNLPDDLNENKKVKLFCYGSYKLGVSEPSGDIDVQVVAPSYVDRQNDFFGVLYPLLDEMSATNAKIQNLIKVEHDTIMPLINLNFYNVSFDLVFARVQNIGKFCIVN